MMSEVYRNTIPQKFNDPVEHFERVSVVAMRRPQHNKIGNVHLKWHSRKVRFSFSAIMNVARGGMTKMSIIAQKLGRTVYYMLRRRESFNPDLFYGDKKIENKDSGGEHLA